MKGALPVDRTDHIMLFRKYVSRIAAGKERAILEGVGLDYAAIDVCFASSLFNEEEALQAGLIRWRDGQGLQPPTWGVLITAMEYAGIAQEDVDEALYGEYVYILYKIAICRDSPSYDDVIPQAITSKPARIWQHQAK